MAHEMTAKWLKAHCKENGGYGTPELNDKLYLHFQGFDRIQNLEAYTGLKSLFLEGNGLEDLEGLSACVELRCLFAQQNMVTAIPASLPVSLSTLNVSNNNVSHLRNVARLAELQTLQAGNCKLKTLESLEELRECANLSTVDLQNNEIDGDPEAMVALFASMPKLACLYMQGNPVVSQLRQYRKRMIASIKTLAYLDDRPVFPLERHCAEAWAEGGLDAEKAARKAFKDEEAAKQRRDHEYLTNLRERSRAKREALAEKGKKALADLGLSDSDGEYEPEEEPPELVAARAKLAQYEARPGEEEPPELTAARAAASAAAAAGGGAQTQTQTRPWQPLGGPGVSGGANDGGDVMADGGMTAEAITAPGGPVGDAPEEPDGEGLAGLRGIVELSGRGNRGGAAGRAAESDETNENVEPVAAAAPAMAPVAKADPSAVAEDTTCLDELD
jgi:dynein assembly factor 1